MGREETKQKLFRGVDVHNILAGLLLVLGTAAIIIYHANFSAWLHRAIAEN